VVRLTIHVRPGSRVTEVGGRHGDALIVRLRERPIEGRATQAALVALAAALGVPTRDVVLIAGAKSRVKIVQVPDSVAARVAELGSYAR
jgi:uncharacterized protein YggU (UPF0235/DUF167 family)